MVLPKLIFLHLSQLCLPHFYIPVHSSGTPMTSVSFKVVLLWCCASCWWSCCPSPLQWWSVTREGMTALRLRSALCPTCTMQCPYKQGQRGRISQSQLLGEKSIRAAMYFASWALSYLLHCSSTSAVSPLKKPHLAWSHLKQLGQETSCSDHWINGLGLLHERNPFRLLSMSGSHVSSSN